MNTNKIVNDVINDIAKKQVNKYIKAGKLTIKQMRNQIIKEWFGSFHPGATLNATYEKASTKWNDKNVFIIVKSGFDISKYQLGESILRWNTKEREDSPNGYDVDLFTLQKYVLENELYKGIIGLPEYTTVAGKDYSGMGWKDGKNLNFHQQSPLFDYLTEHASWVNWKQNVENNVK